MEKYELTEYFLMKLLFSRAYTAVCVERVFSEYPEDLRNAFFENLKGNPCEIEVCGVSSNLVLKMCSGNVFDSFELLNLMYHNEDAGKRALIRLARK